MASRAAEDFSTVTDLADLLVRKADASFRDAHHIIGAVVRQALEAGIPAKDITPQMTISPHAWTRSAMWRGASPSAGPRQAS
ncbi:hypothetical protein G6F22_020212 [Rhizopus arrhizus]|nr:hypothetical protein G6F22_020212 [Rhizopus arrhizus]